MGIQKLNMKIFIKDPSDFTTQTLYVEDACLVADLKEQISEKMAKDKTSWSNMVSRLSITRPSLPMPVSLTKVRCPFTSPSMVVRRRERRSHTSTRRESLLSSITSPLRVT